MPGMKLIRRQTDRSAAPGWSMVPAPSGRRRGLTGWGGVKIGGCGGQRPGRGRAAGLMVMSGSTGGGGQRVDAQRCGPVARTETIYPDSAAEGPDMSPSPCPITSQLDLGPSEDQGRTGPAAPSRSKANRTCGPEKINSERDLRPRESQPPPHARQVRRWVPESGTPLHQGCGRSLVRTFAHTTMATARRAASGPRARWRAGLGDAPC